jgi:hypothetical protein
MGSTRARIAELLEDFNVRTMRVAAYLRSRGAVEEERGSSVGAPESDDALDARRAGLRPSQLAPRSRRPARRYR